MASVAKNLSEIYARIRHLSSDVQLVAVSKFHGSDKILDAISAGQRVFGENRVQEASEKWPEIKRQHPDVKLHLIGPLQSNKVKEALAIFDVIEVVDRPKIAQLLLKEMQNSGKFVDCYIQVNTGDEPQKAGVSLGDADEFIESSVKSGLPVRGLMCIPPVGEDPEPHFKLLKQLAEKHNIAELSMGMSGDFETAIKCGATYVRVGTAIFGDR